MSDLVAAIGLVLFIEGTFYVLFPEGMQRMMRELILQPPAALRMGGLVGVAVGFLLVWFGYR